MANALIRKHKKQLEKKGRDGDKMIAHLTPGEIVIPRSLAEDDDFRAVLTEFFKENNVDLEKFIVGSGKNKINPKTGLMEFGLFGGLFAPKDPNRPHAKSFSEFFMGVLKGVVGRTGSLEGLTQEEKRKRIDIGLKQESEAREVLAGKRAASLPPRAATPTEISPQVQAAGRAEGLRLRRRTGRRATRLTRPSQALIPATTARARLKTTLG